MRLMLNIDGGSRGNPGPAAAGVVVRAEDGTIVQELGLFIGHATNNVAEYRGLLAGLQAAKELGASEISVLSDSELLVRQMNGQYRVKNEGLRPLFEKAKVLVAQFGRFQIAHIRREYNKEADRLANRAMDLRRDVQDSDL
jgi:ribonuclease HI